MVMFQLVRVEVPDFFEAQSMSPGQKSLRSFDEC